MNIIFLTIGLNVGFFGLFFVYFRRQLKKKINPDNLLNEINEEINHVLIQLNNVTDRNIGLLESRITSLKEILEQVDKKITYYHKEMKKAEAEPIVYSHLVKKKPGNSAQYVALKEPEVKEVDKPKVKPMKTQVLELYRQGFSPDVIASRTGVALGEVELIISLTGRGL